MRMSVKTYAAMLIIFYISSAEAISFDEQSAYLFGFDQQRKAMIEHGIKFDANLGVDSAYLLSGGRDRRSAPLFASQLLLSTTIDMQKIAGWNGVILHGVITARQGQGLSGDAISDPSAPQIANVQSNFGRGNSKSRLTELSIEKVFENTGLNIKLGRFGVGNDFDVMACDFQNNAFCAAQMGKWQSNIWINSPVSQWAARLKYQINPEIFTQIGIYEFNPENLKERHGWNMDMHDRDGITLPIEIVWQPKSFINDLSGSYRIGGMYNSAHQIKNQKDIKTGEAENHTYGTWFALEQQLTAQKKGSKRGLHNFANFTFHNRTTNKVESSQQLGFKYIGLFETKPNDIIGFGINRIQLNKRFTADKSQYNEEAEYNIELNYTHYFIDWLMLRPNFQYVIHPGGTNLVNNALVLGLTTKIIF